MDAVRDVAVFVGSLRKDSINRKVAKALAGDGMQIEHNGKFFIAPKDGSGTAVYVRVLASGLRLNVPRRVPGPLPGTSWTRRKLALKTPPPKFASVVGLKKP